MHRGNYINTANLKRDNEQLRATPPPILKNDHEVSLLKLRLMEMEENLKIKDQEIQRLCSMLENY